jgi:SAM-dependent methyltransferase
MLSQFLQRLIALPGGQGSRTPAPDLSTLLDENHPQDSLLLDLGCGLGDRTLLYSAAVSRHVIGLEIEPLRAIVAHQKAVESGASVSIVIADAAALPFVSGCIQHIVSDDTWEHLLRPDRAMKECTRVLQPNGSLSIRTLPYYSPWGAHAWRWLPIPWLHVFFSRSFFFRLVAFVEQHRRINPRLPAVVHQPWQILSDPAHAQGLSVRALREQLANSELVVQNLNLIPVGRQYHAIIDIIVDWLSKAPYLEELLTGLVIVKARKPQQTSCYVSIQH